MAENQPRALQAVPIDPNAGSASFSSTYSRFPWFAHVKVREINLMQIADDFSLMYVGQWVVRLKGPTVFRAKA